MWGQPTENAEGLIVQLRDEDADVGAIANALAAIRPRAVSTLIAALSDEDRTVRMGVAWALALIGSDEAAPAVSALIEALS